MNWYPTTVWTVPVSLLYALPSIILTAQSGSLFLSLFSLYPALSLILMYTLCSVPFYSDFSFVVQCTMMALRRRIVDGMTTIHFHES